MLIPEISIHALREEGDARNTKRFCVLSKFLSTPSARRATLDALTAQRIEAFLSTPSARRATQEGTRLELKRLISIHALREEGDLIPHRPLARPVHISIHALREEGDRGR